MTDQEEDLLSDPDGAWTGGRMNYEPQDFARCNGNPCFIYCKDCRRNIKNSPVNPDAMRQCYIGPWIMEDEKCPSFIAVPDSRSKEDV